MRVRLRELKPNPLRDFSIDPLDEEIIERLRASINEHGFWGGAVGRQQNGHIELAAGHHRVEAAVREGLEEGEIHVARDMDDRQMIRIYAEENATQRGQAHSTARAGSVAAALRMVAYRDFREVVENSTTYGGDQLTAKGIGWRPIYEYLKGVPGIKESTVQEDLASLKQSGEYSRILAEVRDQIAAEREAAEERLRLALPEPAADESTELEEGRVEEVARLEEEARQARQAEERAAKTTEKALQQEATFDFRGVSGVLKTAHHLRSFREVATSDYVREVLPMDQQAAVAERLVQMAEDEEREMTGLFIRTNLVNAVVQMRDQQRRLAAAEKERLVAADWEKRFADLQQHYLGGLRQVILYGEKLLKHREESPPGQTRPISPYFEAMVEKARQTIAAIEEKL